MSKNSTTLQSLQQEVAWVYFVRHETPDLAFPGRLLLLSRDA